LAELEQRILTDDERGKFLDVIRADTTIGNVMALRKAGIDGNKRDLKQLLDDELLEQAREARGWSLTAVEQTTWDVAKDKTHPAWDRANARILKAYHPAFQDTARLELTGRNGEPMQIEGRQTSLVEVAAVLARSGALRGLVELSTSADGGGSDRLALPAPPDALAEPPVG
jgi:hypothetical protein